VRAFGVEVNFSKSKAVATSPPPQQQVQNPFGGPIILVKIELFLFISSPPSSARKARMLSDILTARCHDGEEACRSDVGRCHEESVAAGSMWSPSSSSSSSGPDSYTAGYCPSSSSMLPATGSSSSWSSLLPHVSASSNSYLRRRCRANSNAWSCKLARRSSQKAPPSPPTTTLYRVWSSGSVSYMLLLLPSLVGLCQAVPREAVEWYPKNHSETLRVFVSHETWPEAKDRAGFQYPRLDARMAHGDEVKLRSVHNSWMMFTDDKAWTMRGRTIELQAPNDLYCTVSLDDKESMLRCLDKEPAFSGWLTVHGVGGHSTLKDARKNMYCSDQSKGIRCISDQTHKSEHFEMFDCPDQPERVVLRGGRQQHYCKDHGEDGVRCVHSKFEDATCFLPVAGDPFTTRVIQTEDEDKASVFIVDREGDRDPKFRCKGKTGFLVADPNTHALTCSEIGGLHVKPSRVMWWSSYQASFKVPALDKWIEAGAASDGDREVRATSSDSGGWALWKVKLMGGHETIRPMIRGVNLGNWLLLEKWMDPALFHDADGKAFEGDCPPLDERGLMHNLDHETKTRRMLNHWKTYITEDDIKWLSEHQINAVRLPFGYWAMRPDYPFIFGQQEFIDKLFDWCEKYDLTILLDFHGLKGSQTGSPTSGNCGACGQDQCGETWIHFLKDSDFNLEIIRDMVDRYSHRRAYMGFEIANEVSGSLNGKDVMEFYQKAYDIIKSKNSDAMVLIYATFNPSTYPFENFQNVFVDQHIYFGMGLGVPTTNQHDNLERAERAISNRHWPLVVGEWSMGASGEITKGWPKDKEADFYKDYSRMQLQAYEKKSIGWFYWSYKTYYQDSTWNYRDMVEKGWIPGMPGNIFASSEWWRLPSCVYDYLDGQCGLAAEEEFAEKHFGEPLYDGFSTSPEDEMQFTDIFEKLGVFMLVMGPVGVLMVFFKLLNPPWFQKAEAWGERKWSDLTSICSTSRSLHHQLLSQDAPEDRAAFANSIAEALESSSRGGRV